MGVKGGNFLFCSLYMDSSLIRNGAFCAACLGFHDVEASDVSGLKAEAHPRTEDAISRLVLKPISSLLFYSK